MRLARFSVDGTTAVGYIDDDAQLVEVPLSWAALLETVTSSTRPVRLPESGARWPLATGRLLAPLEPGSRGVFCIGMNYLDHATEAGDALGQKASRPPVFIKLASAMIGPEDELTVAPAVSSEFDWEVELGVLIGKGCRDVPPADVADHIAGYTIVNDITARDLQRDHGQWLIGKSIEGSSPIGPWVTTSDEIPFPPALEIVLSVNGMEKQRGRTDQMIYSVAEFISMTSRTVALQPGDVFATGTPAGVGFSRTPPQFLRPGDKLHAEIEKLGVLSNVVR